MIVQARRSAFITPSGATRSVDGAELIKVSRACGFPSEPSFSEHIFYRYTHSFVELIGRILIDILRRFVPISATLRTLDTLTTIYQLRCVGLSPPSDGDSIIAQPLAPANGAPPDATRDPLLRDKVHGQEILDVRKALAFAGFTHKSPRAISYVRADKAFNPEPDSYGQEEPERGRSMLRSNQEIGKGRAISM